MTHHATHSVVCAAAPERVYAVVSRTQDWPDLLGPCESVTVLEPAGPTGTELVEITANVGGHRQTWRSRRRFRPEVLGVDARIVEPMPLVAAMRTQWRVVALSAAASLLVLEHDYELVDDVGGLVPGVATAAGAARFIAGAIDANSARELADIAAAAERGAPVRDFHARHTAVVDAPAAAVYPFVREPGRWPDVFEACVAATTVGRDGDAELVRVEAVQAGRPAAWVTRRRCADDIRRVDYDLPVPMPLVETMSGQWRVLELGPDRCVLTVDRWWRILPDVRGIRPDVATVRDAAVFVAATVGANAEAELAAISAAARRPSRPRVVAGG